MSPRPILPALFLALAGGPLVPPAAAEDRAWEVRLLTAPWTQDGPRPELLLDLGGDALDRRLSIDSGAFLARVTGLHVGRTADAGGRTVVLAEGQSLSLESAPGGPRARIDVEPEAGPEAGEALTAALRLSWARKRSSERSVRLRPGRARLWVVPAPDLVRAVLIETWPTTRPGAPPTPQDEALLELVVLRADWARDRRPADLRDSVRSTFVDPFGLEPGADVGPLLRSVVSGSSASGRTLLVQRARFPLGEPVVFELGRADDPEAGPHVRLSATLLPAGAEQQAPGLRAMLSLSASSLQAEGLVLFRQVELAAGEVRAWLVPTEDDVHAVFIRAARERPALGQPVRPGVERERF